MDKPLAHTTARPTSTKHREIPVQAFSAYSAGFRFDAEEQGLPFSTSITNTHGREYTERVRMNTIRTDGKVCVLSAKVGKVRHGCLTREKFF